MRRYIMAQHGNMTVLYQGFANAISSSTANSSLLDADLPHTSLPQTNTSSVLCPWKPATSSVSVAIPSFSMTLGALSNIIALVILIKSYARFRRRSKATFLLFASSLVLTDFAGHIIPGALVLRLYSEEIVSTGPMCQFLGGSLVFFGLCPLFLGCIMAVERCVGVTKPLLHSAVVTSTRTKLAIVLLWLTAGFVAFLPFLNFGRYGVQCPRTWCFIHLEGPAQHWTEDAFALLFSLLGMMALLISLICNTISGVTLIQARIKKQNCNRRAKSHDIEMVIQLIGIMMVSCVCWSPLLVTVGLRRIQSIEEVSWLSFLGVRMASWNQILDPWVYILLRRAVLRKVYTMLVRKTEFNKSKFDRWEFSSFQSSERSVINKF
ncbi:prostaglandin E2 receptor EP1 subtype-like [Stegostoma tigrinum]|uniref:prostaglandin E2 receptor EP1 subtype-like n=1 Tax=Stegostoma tigrinum TaxID=3053191 RepID=UPI00202B58B9|nr:prostaglandin E2 receptor EP1 subtype-like [Stegostoma tigrinum]XP_048377642.1 prostaglandin E2 receptor EP1 subtype-like [Stegostoma tigrinum]XP_048377643.1 prostaglandin E2 receptor EP1 subtype-like [Stegostoma tigrinum]